MRSLEDVNKGCASLTLSASFFSSSSLSSHFDNVKPQVSLWRNHVTCPSLWRHFGSEEVYLFESVADTPEAPTSSHQNQNIHHYNSIDQSKNKSAIMAVITLLIQ